MNYNIKLDLYRYTAKYNKVILLKTLFKRPAFRYMFLKRSMELKTNKVIFNIYRLILKKYQIKYGA